MASRLAQRIFALNGKREFAMNIEQEQSTCRTRVFSGQFHVYESSGAFSVEKKVNFTFNLCDSVV